MTKLQETYWGEVCPDCQEPIPDEAVEGDACVNCGHVFYETNETKKDRALDRAWDLFDTGQGNFQIQREDVTPGEEGDFETCFFSDEEAVGYVFLKALAGDTRCKEALKECYGVELEEKV